MRQVTLCSVLIVYCLINYYIILYNLLLLLLLLIVYCLCAAISSNQFDTSLFVCTNAVLEIYTQYNYASGYCSNNVV